MSGFLNKRIGIPANPFMFTTYLFVSYIFLLRATLPAFFPSHPKDGNTTTLSYP
jgi:hypothetical protein